MDAARKAGLRHRSRQLEALGAGGQFEFAGVPGGLHDDLRQAVKQAARPRLPACKFIRLMAAWVAIARADDFAAPSKVQSILFCATGTTRACASSAATVNTATFAIGLHGFIVGRELNSRRVACCFDFGFGDNFAAVVETLRAQGSRSIFHLPNQMEFLCMACRPAKCRSKTIPPACNCCKRPRQCPASLPGQFQCGSKCNYRVRLPPRLVVVKKCPSEIRTGRGYRTGTDVRP